MSETAEPVVPQKFLIIAGAAKCGTTSLGRWLVRRPDVSAGRRKEPRFFTEFARHRWQGPWGQAFEDGIVSDEAAYLDGFRRKPTAVWGIDASTDYLWHEPSVAMIEDWRRRFETKIVVILRDPVARAISEYQHTVRDHLETESLSRSLALEPERRAAFWHPLFYHVTRSRYAEAVRRYREAFGDDLLVLDYVDLSDRLATLRRVEAFLGLPSMDTGGGADERRNQSYVYRSAAVDRVLRARGVRRMAHRLLPDRVRGALRERLDGLLRTRYRASAAELSDLRARLADDIGACLADPGIPTAHWRQAIAPPEQARTGP